MEGGTNPIRDGDWVVMEWARGLALSAVAGRVALIAKGDAEAGHTHHLKRVVDLGKDGYILRSDNPEVPNLDAAKDCIPIARLAGVVRPEELAPRPGTVRHDVAEAFGLSEHPAPGASHVDGHLFLLIAEEGRLTSPDRVSWPVENRAVSETAFVLTQQGENWRYAGVGRWDGAAWQIPAVDFPTWRLWGAGRGASRRLGEVWSAGAGRLAAFLEAELEPGDPVEGRSRSCRFQGRAAQGGIRVDHETMKERTVSLTDLAWALAARNDVEANGGVLDEGRVNYLRYLDGTPKESTRWIDTGWALVLLAHAEKAGFVATLRPVEGERLLMEEEGRVVDATFHVDRGLDSVSVVLEARGGTAGSADVRNSEYGRGLELLMERLAALEAVLLDAYVDSSAVTSLPLPARRLDISPLVYPVELGEVELEGLRRVLSAGMAGVGRADGARGSGNSTKRLRLVVRASDGLVEALRSGT